MTALVVLSGAKECMVEWRLIWFRFLPNFHIMFWFKDIELNKLKLYQSFYRQLWMSSMSDRDFNLIFLEKNSKELHEFLNRFKLKFRQVRKLILFLYLSYLFAFIYVSKCCSQVKMIFVNLFKIWDFETFRF